MATYVHELRGFLSNVEKDTELIFPNIQSCVAAIARIAGTLVGAHMTIGDRSRVAAVVAAVENKALVRPAEVFLIGPNLSAWDLSPFKYGGAATVRACDASLLGDVDVKATLNGVSVRYGIQPNATNATQKDRNEFQAISPTVFRPI